MSNNEISTAVGIAKITPTDNHHVYVEVAPAIVRGIEYHTTFHIFKWTSGQWHLGMEDQQEWDRQRNAYISRIGEYGDKANASDSARNKIIEAVIPAVIVWASLDESKKSLLNAHMDYEKQAIENKENEVTELQKKIAKLQQEIAEISNGSLDKPHKSKQ